MLSRSYAYLRGRIVNTVAKKKARVKPSQEESDDKFDHKLSDKFAAVVATGTESTTPTHPTPVASGQRSTSAMTSDSCGSSHAFRTVVNKKSTGGSYKGTLLRSKSPFMSGTSEISENDIFSISSQMSPRRFDSISEISDDERTGLRVRDLLRKSPRASKNAFGMAASSELTAHSEAEASEVNVGGHSEASLFVPRGQLSFSEASPAASSYTTGTPHNGVVNAASPSSAQAATINIDGHWELEDSAPDCMRSLHTLTFRMMRCTDAKGRTFRLRTLLNGALILRRQRRERLITLLDADHIAMTGRAGETLVYVRSATAASEATGASEATDREDIVSARLSLASPFDSIAEQP